MEGRPKHYWSIYQKMIVRRPGWVRILCDEIRDCYAAVGVVHSLWRRWRVSSRTIAQPRYGVY